MKLCDYLNEQCVFIELQPADKHALLAMLAEAVARCQPGVDRDRLTSKLLDRENEGSTGIGRGMAVPHATIEGLPRTLCMIARLPDGLDFDAIDQKPVRLVFLLVSPPGEIGLHVRLLARIARMVKSGEFLSAAQGEVSAQQLCAIVQREDERHAG
jgi:PTS system nitrogen regulatory IIA component